MAASARPSSIAAVESVEFAQRRSARTALNARPLPDD
jgi:hypothetical protein